MINNKFYTILTPKAKKEFTSVYNIWEEKGYVTNNQMF